MLVTSLDSMPPSLIIRFDDDETERFCRGDCPEGDWLRDQLARGEVQSVHFVAANGDGLGVWYP